MIPLALIGILFFLVLILIAIRLGITKRRDDSPEDATVIHTSGIYSIVRQSPRQAVPEHKPTEEQLRQYLASQNVDTNGKHLFEGDSQSLLSDWSRRLQKSIDTIEEGDTNGVEFYFYDVPEEDTVCVEHIDKGHFVTREEIHKHPQLIPPFHLGCSCTLVGHDGEVDLQETRRTPGLHPLFRNDTLPQLPDWRRILKP